MRRLGAIALPLWLAACGGGGDNKTGVLVTVRLGSTVPTATVTDITRIDLALSAGAVTDAVMVPVRDKLADRETSFRYLDDGRFEGMTVHLVVSAVGSGGTTFTGSKDVLVKRHETVEVGFDFGGGADDGGMEADAAVCPTPPACGSDAAKSCVSGTFVAFGTGAMLAGADLQLTIHDASDGAVLGTVRPDGCGRFASDLFVPPAGARVGLVVDDRDGSGLDRFDRTAIEGLVSPGVNLTGLGLRVMSRAEDEKLSVEAHLCTQTPCVATQTFAGRGSAVVFFRRGTVLENGVRLTRGPLGAAPSLITGNVFYFSDDVEGRQTTVAGGNTETDDTGAVIAVSAATGDALYGGSGGLDYDNAWLPAQAYTEPTLISIIDAVHSMARTCNPLDQSNCANATDACYPGPSAGTMCRTPGAKADGAGCASDFECAKGLACDTVAGTCAPICSLAAPACAGRTCIAFGGSATVGICH